MAETQTQEAPAEPATANDAKPPKSGERAARRPAPAAAAARTPVRVTFTDPDEWLAELQLDSDAVETQIVRTAVRRIPADAGAGMQRVDVIAGYVARGHVIELVTVCGVDWHTDSETDRATTARAEDLQSAVSRLCRELGLELRAGRFGALE